MPLVPSALALWAINFIDRIFIAHYKGQAEVGVYSVAVRISSAIVFLMIAFRARLAGVRLLDRRRPARRSARTPTCSPTCCSSARGSRSRSACSRRGSSTCSHRGPGFARAADAVAAALPSRATAYAGYTVVAIGIGRARQTQFNWVVSGIAAARQHRPERRPDPAVRDDRRRDRDRSPPTSTLFVGMVAQLAPRLPGRLPVAARADARRRRDRADRRSAACPTSRSRSRS